MGGRGVWGACTPSTTIISGLTIAPSGWYNHLTNLLEVQHGQSQNVYRFSHFHGANAGVDAHVLRLPRSLNQALRGFFLGLTLLLSWLRGWLQYATGRAKPRQAPPSPANYYHARSIPWD